MTVFSSFSPTLNWGASLSEVSAWAVLGGRAVVDEAEPRRDHKPPLVPSHPLLGFCDNPQPSHTLSRFLNDTQPWQVASRERKSVFCVSLSKWNSKRKREKKKCERKWHQIFPCATIWLSNSLSDGVLVLRRSTVGFFVAFCGHLSFHLEWSSPRWQDCLWIQKRLC